MTSVSPDPRPRALVTAPFRGEGLDRLRALADVVLDPWIDHDPLRMYSAEQLAERARREEASIIVCEADRCAGPVFDLPLAAIGATRGDPTNVDVAGATAAGIPVLGSGPGGSTGVRRDWPAWARSGGRCAGASRAWVCRSWPTTRTLRMRPAPSTSCSSAPT